MKDQEIIELFKNRKSLFSSLNCDIDKRSTTIGKYMESDDPNVLISSLDKMMSDLTKIRDIDRRIMHLIGGNSNLFKLYGDLTDSLIEEKYEESYTIKMEIDKELIKKLNNEN